MDEEIIIVETISIKLDADDNIIALAEIGGIEGGIEVAKADVPAEVYSNPFAYRYINGAFVVNPDYTPPTYDNTQTVEERLEALAAQAEYFDEAIAEIMLNT